MVGTVLICMALALFILAAIPWAPVEPFAIKLIAAGLACLTAAHLFGGVGLVR